MDATHFAELWLIASFAVTITFLVFAVFSIPVESRAERRRWASAMRRVEDAGRNKRPWPARRKR